MYQTKAKLMSGKDEIRIRLAGMDDFINPSSCRGHRAYVSWPGHSAIMVRAKLLLL